MTWSTGAACLPSATAVEPPVSPHARRILEGSLREALKRGEGYIGVEHLLLALLADSRNGAVQTLEALKTTPKQIRRQLDQQWSLEASQAASEVLASPEPADLSVVAPPAAPPSGEPHPAPA